MSAPLQCNDTSLAGLAQLVFLCVPYVDPGHHEYPFVSDMYPARGLQVSRGYTRNQWANVKQPTLLGGKFFALSGKQNTYNGATVRHRVDAESASVFAHHVLRGTQPEALMLLFGGKERLGA